jgi:hypothetical protein
MKLYEMTYIVTVSNMTRHDVNKWIRDMGKQAIPISFIEMMKDGGQTLRNGPDRLFTAVLVEIEAANPDIIESINAQQPKQ